MSVTCEGSKFLALARCSCRSCKILLAPRSACVSLSESQTQTHLTVVLSKSPTVQHAPLRLSHISAIKYVLMSSRLGVVVVPPGAGPWFFPSRPSARTQSLYMRHTESAHKDASTEGDRRDADATTSAVRPHGKKRGERQAARLGTCECQLILTPGIRSAGDALPPAHLLCAQPLPL